MNTGLAMPWRRKRLEALRRSLAAWIAATAKLHGLEVLTFNMADFRPMGITCRDLLAGFPGDASD